MKTKVNQFTAADMLRPDSPFRGGKRAEKEPSRVVRRLLAQHQITPQDVLRMFGHAKST